MSTPIQPTPPASAAKTSAIVQVRGDAFFVRRLDLPAGTSAQEVTSFVALQLEELSPFPLDQLYHGHVLASDRRAVLVYAAYRRRFPAEQTERWPGAESVLPDFVAALRLKFPVATVVRLRTEVALAALYFDADRELPARVASRPLAPDAPEELVEKTRETVRQLIAADTAAEVHLQAKAPPTRRAKGLQFFLESDPPGAGREVFIPGADSWAMDVRDPEFVAGQRQRQGFDVVLWRVVFGAAAAMALLLAAEMLLGLSQGYASWVKGRNTARAPEVLALQQREMEARSLEDFGRSGVQPFDMLTAVIQVAPRSPDNRRLINLTRATAKGAVLLEIEGTAQDVASINAYEAALKVVPSVERVEVRPPSTGTGGSSFKIAVTFKQGGINPAAVAQGTP